MEIIVCMLIIILILGIPMILFMIFLRWGLRKTEKIIDKTIIKGANKVLPAKWQKSEDYFETPEGQKTAKNIGTVIKLFNYFNKK